MGRGWIERLFLRPVRGFLGFGCGPTAEAVGQIPGPLPGLGTAAALRLKVCVTFPHGTAMHRTLDGYFRKRAGRISRRGRGRFTAPQSTRRRAGCR